MNADDAETHPVKAALLVLGARDDAVLLRLHEGHHPNRVLFPDGAAVDFKLYSKVSNSGKGFTSPPLRSPPGGRRSRRGSIGEAACSWSGPCRKSRRNISHASHTLPVEKRI